MPPKKSCLSRIPKDKNQTSRKRTTATQRLERLEQQLLQEVQEEMQVDQDISASQMSLQPLAIQNEEVKMSEIPSRQWLQLENTRLQQVVIQLKERVSQLESKVGNQALEFLKEIRELRQQNERQSQSFTSTLSAREHAFARERETWTDALFSERQQGNKSEGAQKSIYYKTSRIYFDKYKAEFDGTDDDLVKLQAQLGQMNNHELEKVNEHMKDLEFWEYFKNFGYAQPAAFISALVTDNSRRESTVKAITVYISRFCEIFRDVGVTFIDRKTILSSKVLVDRIGTLKALASKDKAVQAMYQMNRMISGHNIRLRKTDFQQLPKILVPYGQLMNLICEYRDFGNPKYRKAGKGDKMTQNQLQISKMFGLFLTLLAITVQRNSTIRQVKLKNFYIQGDKPTLYLKSTKTGKEDEYYISPEILKMVEGVKVSRANMKEELKRCKAQCKDPATQKLEKQKLRARIHILKRRVKYLFSFFNKSGVHHHLVEFKVFMQKSGIQKELADNFKIHDIRRIMLQQIANSQGIEAAMKAAQHTRADTTSIYLRQRMERQNIQGIAFKTDQFLEGIEELQAEEAFQNTSDSDSEGEEIESSENESEIEGEFLAEIAIQKQQKRENAENSEEKKQ